MQLISIQNWNLAMLVFSKGENYFNGEFHIETFIDNSPLILEEVTNSKGEKAFFTINYHRRSSEMCVMCFMLFFLMIYTLSLFNSCMQRYQIKGLLECYPSKRVNPSWRAKDSPGLQAKFYRLGNPTT